MVYLGIDALDRTNNALFMIGDPEKGTNFSHHHNTHYHSGNFITIHIRLHLIWTIACPSFYFLYDHDFFL